MEGGREEEGEEGREKVGKELECETLESVPLLFFYDSSSSELGLR